MRPGACTNIENQNGRPLGEITLARNAEAKVRQEDNNTGVNPFLADRWIHAGENARLFVDYYDTWNNDSIRRAIYDAQNLPQSAAGIVHLLNNQTLWDLDLTNPRDAALELSGSWDESGWHANSLTLDGNTRTQYIDVRGGELHIKGSFENTDRIELHKEQGAVPRLSFVDKPKIIGKLRIYVYDVESEEAARACVTGVDNLECNRAWEDGPWVLYSRSGAFEALKAACADESAKYIDLSEINRLRIEENVTIPERLEINAWDTVIEVPEGVTLTVNRGFYPNGFVLNGTVNVSEGVNIDMGTMFDVVDGRPAGELNVGNRCRVEIKGIGFDPEFKSLYLDGAKLPDWIHKSGERGSIRLCFNVVENGDFEEFYPIAAALSDPFVGRLYIGYPYTLQDNLNAYGDHVELIVENGGSLTIPAGKTLVAHFILI